MKKENYGVKSFDHENKQHVPRADIDVNTGFNPYIAVFALAAWYLMLLILIISSIFVSWLYLETMLILLGITVIITIPFAIIFFRNLKTYKKMTKVRKEKPSAHYRDFEPNMTFDIGSKLQTLEELSTDVKDKVESMKYHGSITNQKCVISKVSLEPSEIIIECPSCLSLYKEHYIVEWLKKDRTCPVCKKELV